MKNLQKYIWILSFLYLFFNCNKDKGYKTVYLDPSVKAKYYFKKGSYWIYRDSISGREDSFFINKTENYYPPARTEDRQERESVEMYITEKNIATSDSISWVISLAAPTELKANYIKPTMDTLIAFQTFYSPNLLTSQSKIQNFEFSDIVHSSIVNLPSFSLNGILFFNVGEIHYERKPGVNKSDTYYFNDSVGYIKMRLNYDDGKRKIAEVWELRQWRIIK